MQIGEFARVCDTKISVLRHYDKEGLLIPDYIDKFTGYRYYSKEQIPIFVRITALKDAGFTLHCHPLPLPIAGTPQTVSIHGEHGIQP